MGNKDEEEKKPPAMRRPRPSEIRRHGFGSPEGMEMTDIPRPAPAEAESSEATEQVFDPFGLSPSPATRTMDPSQSMSPLEEASAIALTTDSTPPSATVASLRAETPASDPQQPSPSQSGDSKTPSKKLRKRRLFFTPSRRKSKTTPPNPNPNRPQQPMTPTSTTMPSPISQRIPQTPPIGVSRPTDTPVPTSQFGTPRPSRQPKPGRQRKRQTGAPMPKSGLSGYSTPGRTGGRLPPTSSGRRKKKFNPLERISDIFSPQDPDFESSSPIHSDADDTSENDEPDSSFSDSSFSEGSVKEPFVEQVERLSQLLATPSQQLGDLALTTDDRNYRSDDDLDDEMEDLEIGRRLLAEELSKVDFSLLDRTTTTPQAGGKSTTISPSPSPNRRQKEEENEDIDWVPLLEVEANHPPNFSPAVADNDNVNSGLSPMAIFASPESVSSPSASREATVYEGHEFYSPTSTIDEDDDEEDKKPAAKDYSSPDRKDPPPSPERKDPPPSPGRKKPPPTYPSPDRKDPPPSPERKDPPPSPDRKKPPPTYPSPDRKTSPTKKNIEETKYSPRYTPPRPLSGGGEENVAMSTGELDDAMGSVSRESDDRVDIGSPLYIPPRPLSGESENNVSKSTIELDDIMTIGRLSREGSTDKEDIGQKGETIDSGANSPDSDQIATEEEDPKLSTPQSKDEGSNPSDEGSGAHSPESIPFDPFGLGPRGASHMSSTDTVSELGEGSVSPSSSTGRNDNLILSFLSFAKRFSDDGRSLASDSTRNVENSRLILERLNTIFPSESRHVGREVRPSRGTRSTDEARATKSDAPKKGKSKGDEKEILVTPPRASEALDKVIHEPPEDIIFGLSSPSEDSELTQNNSFQEQMPLLGPPPESDSIIKPSTDLSKPSTATKTVSDSKGSKPSKFEDTSDFVPIFSDDSDDEIVFQKDSTPSLFSQDIVPQAPGESQIKPAKAEKPNVKNDKNKKGRPGIKWQWEKKRNWLLVFAILLFVVGIGLVVGTIVFPGGGGGGGEETPAPSTSVTVTPTQEAKPAPITLSPLPSFSPTGTAPVPSRRPSADTLLPSFSPSASPSMLPSARTPMPSFSPSLIPSLNPSLNTPMPSFHPSEIPSVLPATNTPLPSSVNASTVLPSEDPSISPTIHPSVPSVPTSTIPPSGISVVPSSRPSVNPTIASSPIPFTVPSKNPSAFPTREGSDFPSPVPSMSPFTASSPIPSTAPSKNPSAFPTLEGSDFPSTEPSISPVAVPSFPPTPMPSSPSPSKFPTEEPSFSPTNKGSEMPTPFPSTSPVTIPSFSPSRMPLVPTLPPSAKTMTPSNIDPSIAPSEQPSTSPSQNDSEPPTLYEIISFTVTYKIFILNGLVEFVPQSEYVPELILSMDLLTDDILLNIASKKKRIGDGRILTEVVLPTSIIEVFNVSCPEDVENSLCQEVVAEITLLNAEDSWQLFKDTTELAIEIGRLQFHLERVDESSPVEIIDSGWEPPRRVEPDEKPIVNPPTDNPVGIPTSKPRPDFSIPISAQRFPTSSPTLFPTRFPTANPTLFPTPFSLFDFLGENSFDGGEALKEISSPQYIAYSWLSDNERIAEYSEQRLLQRYSMATLYYATNGDQWINNTFWMSDQPECTWFGKTGSKERCNKKGELINLELDLNNLNGSLPPELGLLSSSLETITLSGGPDSDISGTLPTELGYLTLLQVFVVQNNDLSGSIPSEIGNWQRLKGIDLSQNRLRGELPTQIGNLLDLTIFEVNNNMLSGSLPSELGQLAKCQMMIFEENAFDSFIPTEIGDLKQLTTLKGGSNKFDSLPTELGKLKSADIISFQNCSIAGPIPTELGNLQALRQLDLGYNNLSGNIPSELAKIKSLQKLDLSYNQLSGPLPTEFGSFVDLRGIKLDNNFLSGMIPSEISKLSKLTSIQLNSNDFSGTIPSAVCETFNATFPAFQADCGDFDGNCPCCTICCVEDTCTCRHIGTTKEFLCYQRSGFSF